MILTPAEFNSACGAVRYRSLTLANRILRSPEDAEDCVQVALTNAWLNLGSMRGDATFSTWFYRIVVNQALMMLRKRKTRDHEVAIDAKIIDRRRDGTTFGTYADILAAPERDILKDLSCGEQRERLMHHVRTLSPALQRQVQMYLAGEYDSSDLLQKSRMMHARAALRRRMAN